MSNLLQRTALKVAQWAGYNAALPNKTQKQADRSGISPNSGLIQQQRGQLSLEALNIVRNTAFGRNYVDKRLAYCSGQISWNPDTGDAELDEDVSEILKAEWATMGVECSMYDAFSRVADVALPIGGDAALQWYRDMDRLRLIEITSDRIGEPMAYLNMAVPAGLEYCQGLFFQGPNVVAYRIYDAQKEGSYYTNAKTIPASDIIFFKDDIEGGVRGISKFATAYADIAARHQILRATTDTMLQQSKTAAISYNNSGAPSEYDFQTNASNGVIDYVETYADGAVVGYKFNGDSYQVLKAEHPSTSFLLGLKYVDQQASLAVGFPYEFLFTPADSGGAPARLSIEIASREITRIRERVHRPRLNKISYATIMDLVQRGKLPAVENIMRGSWQFGTLPTADAFRDDKSDIAAIRAGITTRATVIAANSGRTYASVLRESTQEAIEAQKALQSANKQLEAEGFEPSLTMTDILTNTDNPPQVQAESKSVAKKPKKAKKQSPTPALVDGSEIDS